MSVSHACAPGLVFKDSSSLGDLRELVTDGVHKSDTLVLLATKGVLLRPWCLIELLEAQRKCMCLHDDSNCGLKCLQPRLTGGLHPCGGSPIVIVTLHKGGFSFDEACDFLSDLNDQMQALNPAGYELLTKQVGPDLSELQGACIHALTTNRTQQVVFDSHAGDNATVASLKNLVEQMARVTGRRIQWKGGPKNSAGPMASESSFTRKMPQQRKMQKLQIQSVRKTQKLRILSVRFNAAMFANITSARNSRSTQRPQRSQKPKWKRRSSRSYVTQVNNPQGAARAVVVCSRRDAVMQARVLCAELELKLDDACGSWPVIEHCFSSLQRTHSDVLPPFCTQPLAVVMTRSDSSRAAKPSSWS